MAYSYTTTKKRHTYQGRQYYTYTITETEASSMSEYIIDQTFELGTIVLYCSEITSGSATNMRPSIGTEAGFTENTLNHVATNAKRKDKINDRSAVSYRTAIDSRDLYIRSNPNFGSDNSITTTIVIAEGTHGTANGTGTWITPEMAVEDDSILRKWGTNDNVGTSYETVWSGSNLYTFPTSALAMTAESTSVLDTQELTVIGLDANNIERTQVVTLTGTTPVSIPIPLRRVYRASVDGSATNIGLITIENGITEYARIEIGAGQTQMAIYTVPAGFEFELILVQYTGASSASGNILDFRLVENRLRVKDNAIAPVGDSNHWFGSFDTDNSGQIFPSGTDLEVQVIRQSGSAGKAAARFIGRLRPVSIS